MATLASVNLTIAVALLVSCIAYVFLSRAEGSYLNILTPAFIVAIPAYYLLPWGYAHLFGVQASKYAVVYVYATLAAEDVAFVYAYLHANQRLVRVPFLFGYRNLSTIAYFCLGVGLLLFVPLLWEFRELIFDPREIYRQTRTGFGVPYYISSILAYLAVILILFSKARTLKKSFVVALSLALLLLHGSKAQVLNLVLILALYWVYGMGKRVGVGRTLIACFALALLVLLLFAGTMSLGESPEETLEAISEYSDYTQNATKVIDSHFPLQYGRLTLQSNTISLVPRALMPNKPKNFGPFLLAEEFYPEAYDADSGSPAFGVGVQYADFGYLAIVALILFGLLRGWLARVFVNRLRITGHPADFLVVTFLAGVTVFPIGVGWPLPEVLAVALVLRFLSRAGRGQTYREYTRDVLARRLGMNQEAGASSV